jgi:hypothetical protein
MMFEILKGLTGRLVAWMAYECRTPTKSVGSMTYHPPGAAYGVEGDEQFFLANESAVRGRDDYDPYNDPPIDLAVEIDYATGSEKRLAVFATWGVSEIWRHDGREMTFLQLNGRGAYVPIERSLAFPFVQPGDIVRFLEMRRDGEMSMLRRFIAWVRRNKDAAPTARRSRKRKQGDEP